MSSIIDTQVVPTFKGVAKVGQRSWGSFLIYNHVYRSMAAIGVVHRIAMNCFNRGVDPEQRVVDIKQTIDIYFCHIINPSWSSKIMAVSWRLAL